MQLGQLNINSTNITRFFYFSDIVGILSLPVPAAMMTEMKYTIRMHEGVPSVSSVTGHQLDPDHGPHTAQ